MIKKKLAKIKIEDKDEQSQIDTPTNKINSAYIKSYVFKLLPIMSKEALA
jgi:hypothetical protein